MTSFGISLHTALTGIYKYLSLTVVLRKKFRKGYNRNAEKLFEERKLLATVIGKVEMCADTAIAVWTAMVKCRYICINPIHDAEQMK